MVRRKWREKGIWGLNRKLLLLSFLAIGMENLDGGDAAAVDDDDGGVVVVVVDGDGGEDHHLLP